jgi:class 3 adenylate cyclase
MLSRIRSLLRVFGRPEPRYADGIIALTLIMILVWSTWAVLAHRAVSQPDIALYLDRNVMKILFDVSIWSVGISVAFLLAALVARRYQLRVWLLAHIFAQFWFAVAAIFSYSLGPLTDLMASMALFIGTVTFIALLGTRVALGGIVSFSVLLVGVTVAERWNLIPYAPAFVSAPYQAGHLSEFWFWWGVNGISGLVFAVIIFVGTTERLRRATALIQRYVPAQLAEKILSGEHVGGAQPERRKLTLFFSDVVGFTNSADQMEPEDLASLLNEYLGEMSKIADEFGATLNQFVGDGIMIFFGAPDATSDQDHAMRAVRMSLAMQQRMTELGRKWFDDGIQTPFRIRIGINTGVASIGDFGSEGRTTYSAIGNQTNLTARIQDHCEPGKVLISHTTWALVKDEIACLDRGEIEVKGIHYPVRVYEVAKETPVETGNA